MKNDQGLLNVDGYWTLSKSPDLEPHDDQWVPTDDGQYVGRFDAFVTMRASGKELADLSQDGVRTVVFGVADIPNLIAQLTEIRVMAMREGILKRLHR